MDNTATKKDMCSMLSLIKRMDEKRNYFQAEMLTEAMTKAALRKQVTRDEIFGVIDNDAIKGGTVVHITYVSGKSPYKNKFNNGVLNWRKEEMAKALGAHGDMTDKEWHRQLSNFNNRDKLVKGNPITNVVAVESFLLNWTTPKSFSRAYGEYAQKLGNLRMRYGVGLPSNGVLGDNHNVRRHIDGGGQFNQTGALSKDINKANAKIDDSKMYLIDAYGNIQDEIPDDVVSAMTAKPNKVEKDVRAALTPEQIKEYVKEKEELEKAFKAQNLKYDGILSIVARVNNGDFFYYINDKLVPSKVKVNQAAFTKMAEKALGRACDAIQGFAQP